MEGEGNGPPELGEKSGVKGIGNQWKNQDNLDYSIVDIG